MLLIVLSFIERVERVERVERKFPILYGKMRTTFIYAWLEMEEAQKYWCECTNTLINLNNIKCVSEKLEGRMPNCSHFYGLLEGWQ